MSSGRHASYALVKRSMDVAAAAGLLAALAPVLVAIAVAIRISMGRPVLFRQTRPGRDGRPFTIYKFRTMTQAPSTLPDRDRMTRLGRWLRELSLDELPQLWNVLRGDMSLVGPRPLLERYLPWFTERERTRFTVRPGITGWAQVNGRANAPWDERLEMDAWYVDQRGLTLDLKILALTALRVVQRKDVHVRPSPALRLPLDVERSLRQRRRERDGRVDDGVTRRAPAGRDVPWILSSSSALAGTPRPVIDAVELCRAPQDPRRLRRRSGDVGGHAGRVSHRRRHRGASGRTGDNGVSPSSRSGTTGPETRSCAASPSRTFAWRRWFTRGRGGRDVTLGPGTVVVALAAMDPGAVAGTGVVVNTLASVAHDCVLGDGAFVAPGARLTGDIWVGDPLVRRHRRLRRPGAEGGEERSGRGGRRGGR